MYRTDDAAWEAILERQRSPSPRARFRQTWNAFRRLWPLWATLLVAVVVVAGWRYATANETRLYAFSATDGQVRWSSALPEGTEEISIPAASGGRVIILTENGRSNPVLPQEVGTVARLRVEA